MLARKAMAGEFQHWNRRWGAPFGFHGYAELCRPGALQESVVRRVGMFGAQPNSSTRRVEFPWAFHASPVRPGMRAVEIGGGMSGFQFALDRSGARVINVDPFVGYGEADAPWPDPVESHKALNRLLGTRVELRRSRLGAAGLPSDSADAVYCISTLEHLAAAEVDEVLAEARRILRPGGDLVLTVDLFLDIHPFTGTTRNQWGRNVRLADLVAASGLRLITGDRRELLGFPEFSPERVLAELDRYEVNDFYPQLAQLLVLRKPDTEPPLESPHGPHPRDRDHPSALAVPHDPRPDAGAHPISTAAPAEPTARRR
ncbi:SAM-dependent methyltransferase [Planotetraspora sp. GP83]